MKAEEFKRLWTESGESLRAIQAHNLRDIGLSETTHEFLRMAGLPIAAAPFLSFYQDVENTYTGIRRLTKMYDHLEGPAWEKYIVIGSDGEGSPIVINTDKSDRIELLDHEINFSAKLCNSSIHRFAACLYFYRSFVETIQEENGEDAFMDGDFTDEHLEQLKQNLHKADPGILEIKGFWSDQITMALGMREYYQEENQA